MKARDRVINALKCAGLSLPDIADAVEALERIVVVKDTYGDREQWIIEDNENGSFQ